MNIYLFKIDEEEEYIAAYTAFEALKHYNEITELEISEFSDDDDIILIPKEIWKNYNVIIEENGKEKKQTFAEYMKKVDGVEYIASTVF